MRSFYNEVQIEVEGEPLHLVMNFRAIDVIESLTEQTIPEIIPQLADNPPYSLVGKVLWAVLREKHEGVTLDQAASVAFDPVSGAVVGAALGDLIRRSFNLGEAKEENPPTPAGASKPS